MNIYVGNFGYEASEDQVRNIFSTYGEVTTVKLISDPLTGRLKGFGFIEMPNNSEAEKAINELNNSRLDDQVITVNEARPKTTNLNSGTNRRY
ncbi:RNA recognition motif domain-containing protein [Flavobacterium sp. AG291]|uniref:RNA recognition motif domain-containing protein n=1 Tax=Flavobacterium sp. AG291 TaxID=2184000 RepID=UPI000E0BF1E4|nr:RNA-binding protein [Flavobacterium sp. AG291]RDI04508.1 RNA recognition motif-containing protein [Flavobacterium sp. AG291]